MKQSDGGLAPSYNVQISADATQGIIVGVEVTPEASDGAQLLPALERIEQRLKQKPQQIVADGGYTTCAAIQQMAERRVDFLGNLGRDLAGAEWVSRWERRPRRSPRRTCSSHLARLPPARIRPEEEVRST